MKVNFTTLLRIFIHVVRQFNSIAFAIQRKKKISKRLTHVPLENRPYSNSTFSTLVCAQKVGTVPFIGQIHKLSPEKRSRCVIQNTRTTRTLREFSYSSGASPTSQKGKTCRNFRCIKKKAENTFY